MHTGVYITKNSKGLVPAELWESILKSNTSGMGVVTTTSDGSIQVQSGKGKPELAELEAFQKEYQDRTAMFYLYEATDDFNVEDIQPFTILTDDKDKPLLAVLLDGEFERHAEANGHTPEYNAAFEYLKDRVESLYAVARGDVKKMMDLMQAKNLRKEIVNVVGEKNSITMLASTGEIVSFGPVENVEKHPWGWATNYYGYGEKKVETKEEPKASGLSKLFAKKAGDAPKVNNPPAQTLQAVAVKPEPAVDKGPGLQEAAKVLNGSTTLSSDDTKEIWVTPKNQLSNNKKAQWYHRLCPSMGRDDWKSTPPVKTSMAELTKLRISDYKIVEAPKAGGLDKLKEYRAFESQQQKEEVKKDVEPHTVQPSASPAATDVRAPVDVQTIPRVPADQAKLVVSIIQNAKKVINPETFKAMERKYPTILDVAGLKNWSDLHKLDYDDILKIAENKHAVSVMVMNLIGQHMRMEERLSQVAQQANQKIAM